MGRVVNINLIISKCFIETFEANIVSKRLDRNLDIRQSFT